MKNWMKLALPVGLGLLGAVINFALLQKPKQQKAFICVVKEVKQGDKFTESNLKEVMIGGDLDMLKGAGFPAENKRVLYDRPASRTVPTGSIILRRDVYAAENEIPLGSDEFALQISLDNLTYEPDLVYVGDLVGFLVATTKTPLPVPVGTAKPGGSFGREPRPDSCEMVGPFRVLSVGSRLQPGLEKGDHKSSSSRDGRIITVAAKRAGIQKSDLDAQSQRLVVAAKVKAGEAGSILTVAVYPRPVVEAPKPTGTAATATRS